MRSKFYQNSIFWAILFYFLLATVFTWPLIFHFKTLLYGIPGDAQGGLWFVWWVKQAVTHHYSLFQTPLMAVPYFSRLPSDLDVLNSLIVSPITLLFGVFAGYNFLVFISFILAGLGMFLLVRYLIESSSHLVLQTSSRLAIFLSALLAGAIYAFLPFHLVRAYQHWDLTQIQWLPFLLLFLFRFEKSRKVKDLIWVVIFLILNFTSLFYGLVAIIIIFFWFLSRIKEKKFILIFIIFLVIIIFNYFTFFQKKLNSFNRPISDFYYYSINTKDYLLPSFNNHWFGKYIEPMIIKDLGGERNTTEKTAYLGLIPMILALLALLKSPIHKKYFFLALAVFAFLLSLSPTVNFFSLSLPTFSLLLYKVAPFARSVGRFSILVGLSTAVLAGLGFAYLGNAMKNYKLFYFILFFVFCFLILFVEYYGAPPKNLTPFYTPPVYDWLQKEPENTIALEYPLKNTAGYGWSEHNYYQIYHEKPLFNALLGEERIVVPDDKKWLWEGLKNYQNIINSNYLSELKKLNVKYLLVHPNAPFSALQFDKPFLTKIENSPQLKKINQFGPNENTPFRLQWDEFQDTIVYEIK